MDILDRLDAAIDSRCPCGADPREGSAYCSDDCVPTHRGRDTTSDRDGTAMRWRPDLVTADDATGRTLVDEFRRGRHNAQVYEYDDSDSLHFRLDDGHRFVGLDVDGLNCQAGHRDGAWERLEREFGNQRHIEPSPPTGCPCGCGLGVEAFLADIGARLAVWDARTIDRAGEDQQVAVLTQDGLARAAAMISARADRHTGLLDLPSGPLLDALVAAESEAQLRARAREIGQRLQGQTPPLDWPQYWLSARYLTAVGWYSRSPAEVFRIISTA